MHQQRNLDAGWRFLGSKISHIILDTSFYLLILIWLYLRPLLLVLLFSALVIFLKRFYTNKTDSCTMGNLAPAKSNLRVSSFQKHPIYPIMKSADSLWRVSSAKKNTWPECHEISKTRHATFKLFTPKLPLKNQHHSALFGNLVQASSVNLHNVLRMDMVILWTWRAGHAAVMDILGPPANPVSWLQPKWIIFARHHSPERCVKSFLFRRT